MKSKRLLLTSLFTAGLTVLGITLAQADSGPAATGAGLITVLNPAIETKLADRVPLAPRLKTLKGKTIYLVDTDWEGMGHNTIILEEIQKWFAQHMPGVKTIIRTKKGGYMQDDPALWKEIADKHGDGVIIGVAG